MVIRRGTRYNDGDTHANKKYGHTDNLYSVYGIGYLTFFMKIYAVFVYGYDLNEFMFLGVSLYDVKPWYVKVPSI
ncbi:hypothetical protein GCM10009129_09690 [Psychrobacter aestuarii]|uniref:Uncharacterized protein n=1 Tax=Psychrobacter aestuarii TaxID=556327 RepID=A0ABP3FC85_9GAMM